VLGLLSVFYLFPTAYGLVGRMFAPGLAQAGQADAVVLLLPGRLIGGPAGELLSAFVVAGAFAAFLSTTSGLVVSLAGVISQDVLGGSVRGFRLAALVSAAVPLAVAFITDSLALAGSVGLVFAFTASTICPVLLLGIWWRGLTDAGAIAGMATGGLLCGGAMAAGAALGAGTPVWLAQPAAWTVPAAFAVMVLTSRATKSRIPHTVTKVMTRLHTPERPLATGR
jgi:Na+(H+)/acetate symporter ActP